MSRRLPWMAVCQSPAASIRWRRPSSATLFTPLSPLRYLTYAVATFSSSSTAQFHTTSLDTPAPNLTLPEPTKQGSLKPGLYLVGTPIGNLEDITLRALRVLKSADVILSEDTRHSGKLLQYYGIKTPLMSYHKFNESQRERTVLKRLQQGEIVALISDAGMPGISDPGSELAKLCAEEKIDVVPIPGASAVVAALSASGLPTDEFTFVGFLPKNAGARRERLLLSANQPATQIFFVPPHKLHQFLEETSSVFSDSSFGVAPWEMLRKNLVLDGQREKLLSWLRGRQGALRSLHQILRLKMSSESLLQVGRVFLWLSNWWRKGHLGRGKRSILSHYRGLGIFVRKNEKGAI